MTSKQREYYFGLGLAGFALLIYVLTLCPTVTFIDSGELATTPYFLGIMHATTYPLYTLVGAIVSHIPLGIRIVKQMNLLIAFESAAALFFFFRFLVFFLNTFLQQRASGSAPRKSADEPNMLMTYIPAACGTLALAFSQVFWETSLAVEVYPLHMFFLITTTYLFTKALSVTQSHTVRPHRYGSVDAHWLGFAYLLGLAFTNHMTTIMLAPAFLYLYFKTFGSTRSSWIRIAWMAPVFIIALTMYYFVIMRAQQNPIFNVGDPSNFERFSWAFTGKIYRRFMFYSVQAASDQFGKFVGKLFPTYGYVALLVIFPGLAKLYRESRVLFNFTLLLFLGCIGYAINYEIPDIDSYFLLGYITLAIWIGAGAAALMEREFFAKNRLPATAGLVGLCILPLITNWQRVDQSKNYWVEDYVHNMFNTMEPNAILFTHQYDWFFTPSQYYQYVEKERPDITLLHKNQVQRQWFWKQLEVQHGKDILLPKAQIAAYNKEMEPVDHDLPYDTIAIRLRILELVQRTLDLNYVDHPLYVTPEIEEAYTPGYKRVPCGLLLRLYKDETTRFYPMPELKLNLPTQHDYNTDRLIACYAQAYANNAIYCSYLGKHDEALKLIDKAIEIMPASDEAKDLKQQLIARSHQ